MRGIRFIAAFIPMLAVSYAMASENNIVGTAHDFTGEGWADSQICKPCHTPHHAKPNSVSGRIWNHTLTTATYTMHGAQTGSTKTGTAVNNLDRKSRLCMSCHDGTIAKDSFGRTAPLEGPGFGTDFIGPNNPKNIAGADMDLSNDHPVGVDAVYDENKSYGGHKPYKPVTQVSAAGLRLESVTKTTTDPTSGQPVSTTVLVVSCNTCHDAHGAGIQDPNLNSSFNSPMLLRAPINGSQMCIACHTK